MFIHGTNIVDRDLKVLFFGLFFVTSLGIGLIVLFFVELFFFGFFFFF